MSSYLWHLSLATNSQSTPVSQHLSQIPRRMDPCRGLLPFPSCQLLLFSSSLLLLLVMLLSSHGAQAYKNYTVGGSLGWYDSLEEPRVNYQKWAAGKNFSLGDFLIFNTDKNHSVIQTYNATTYKRCDYDDAEDDDTSEWSAGEPADDKEAVTLAVPLLKEGATYFFSSFYDGEQCLNGQRFAINVTHGQGLPESLKSPTVGSLAPTSPNDDGNVPDTLIPSNFDNPMDSGAVNASTGAAGNLDRLVRECVRFNMGLVFLGLFWIFG